MDEVLWPIVLYSIVNVSAAAFYVWGCSRKKKSATPSQIKTPSNVTPPPATPSKQAPPTPSQQQQEAPAAAGSNSAPAPAAAPEVKPAETPNRDKPAESTKNTPVGILPSEKGGFTSQKKRKIEEKLEKEKKQKIESGFFASNSEDDTLEKIDSCKQEESGEGNSSKKRSRKVKKKPAENKDKEKENDKPKEEKK
ncbi:unnamed protein product [Bursaphelenchus okinawaensis]|uniref:Uncharacterized protein n=1 Tax=Bursaphelenchus okinawaensis TaxID=465554 RepID=A0A811KFN9_9BILA|nr:unnamed protein product [Bursaphelenchus okinawaensis]CAG9102151.1 unnamed protein product [Bursaphelenchus okinawaensis]